MEQEVHSIVHDEEKAKKYQRYGMNQVAYTADPAIEVLGFYFSSDEEKKELVLSDEMASEALDYFKDKGKKIEEVEKYEEISEEEFQKGNKIDPNNYATIKTESILDRVAPNGEGIYALRYEYSGPLDNKNRTFCRDMLLFRKMYTYEEINTQLSNPDFGNYSIFDYKGSYGCRHKWERRYFFITDEGKTNRVGANPVARAVASTVDQDATTINANLARIESKFSKVDTYKMRVAAPALVPDKKIYRKDEDGHEFFVEFSTKEIERLVSNFQGKKVETQFNVNHTDREAPSYILESWIIESEEDKAYSKYNFEKKDVPVGSWMIVSQITDEEFFMNEIIEKKQYGYSVEGFFDLDLKMKMQEMAKEEIQKFELDGKFYKSENGKLVLLEEEKKDEKTEMEDDKKEEDTKMEDDKTDDKKEELQEDDKKDEKSEMMDEGEEKKEDLQEDEGDEGVAKTYTKEEVDEKIESLVSMIAELEAKITADAAPEEMESDEEKKKEGQFNNQKESKGIAAIFSAINKTGKK